jgi:hypothetical protein
MKTKRLLRNIKSILQYPQWKFGLKIGPDNHFYKMQRIKKLGTHFKCNTFIETGTFYGQTVNYASKIFELVLSVEIYKPLYDYNVEAFKNYKNVKLFHGNSSDCLKVMIDQSVGRIIFWLDGHYSGNGTGIGDSTSPIIEELTIIKSSNKNDHCILIDDYRLFVDADGYPSFNLVKNLLLDINPKFVISIDHDCIIAVPQ